MPTHSTITAHSRALLKNQWGSKSTRLTRDHFLPFASCNLCLLPARDPVSCASQGHIFCRECAIDNLLTQNKEIKRVARSLQAQGRDEVEQDVLRREREQQRDVRDFENEAIGVGIGIGVGSGGGGGGGHGFVNRQGETVRVDESFVHKGVKRKFEMEQERMRDLKRDDGRRRRDPIEKEAGRAAAHDAHDDGKVETSFWIPSKTPGVVAVSLVGPTKTSTTCPATTKAQTGEKNGFKHRIPVGEHEISLKTLVTVNFSTNATSTDGNGQDSAVAVKQGTNLSGGGGGGGTVEENRICPACDKTLSNNTKAVLARPCGHVLCKACATRFLVPTPDDPHARSGVDVGIGAGADEVGIVRCYVCQFDVTERIDGEGVDRGQGSKDNRKGNKSKIRPGLVDICCEGTGFAAGGDNMVKKAGVVFQG